MPSVTPISNASRPSDQFEDKDDDGEEPSTESDDCYEYNCEYDDAIRNNVGDGDDYDDDDENEKDDNGKYLSFKSSAVQGGGSMKGNRSSSASRSGFIIFNLPPPSPPPGDLKNTTSSSPMPEMIIMNGSRKDGSCGLKSHSSIKSLQHRQQSEAVNRVSNKKDRSFSKSKPCSDGRFSEPPDGIDMCSRFCVPHDITNEADVCSKEDGQFQTGKKSVFHGSDLNLSCIRGKNTRDDKKLARGISNRGFKCGVFCMFLPGISKGKHALSTRWTKERREEDCEAVVSRIVSLEKFECGSFGSSAGQEIEEEEEELDYVDSYYDPPLEMTTEEEKDTNSPVQAKFVFQKDRKGELKRSESKLTSKSSRRIRFSASTQPTHPSSPSEVGLSDEQLKKAREDLNGYLEAMV